MTLARSDGAQPRGGLVNPIVRRELLDALRTAQGAGACRWGWPWPAAASCWSAGRPAARPTSAASRSLQVLRVFGYGLLAGVLLLVPAFPATSLVRERVKGTLALLLNTPMSAWSIYLGKLAGVLGFAAVLLVMTLPAAAACYALGGSGVRGGVVALYGVLALAAVQLSTPGPAGQQPVPVRRRRTPHALRPGAGAGGPDAGAPRPTCAATPGPLAEAAAWLRCLSPVPAVMELIGAGRRRRVRHGRWAPARRPLPGPGRPVEPGLRPGHRGAG